MVRILFIFHFFICYTTFSQENPFLFGRVGGNEILMKTFDKDTSANALVLKELGEAFVVSGNEIILVYRYHAKLKVLKNKGLGIANVSISLYKNNEKAERLRSVKASSFNIENGLIKESKLNPKEIFTETINKNWETKKFAIPNVMVGTVIEYEYEIETPFFYSNFKSWEFQSEHPKIHSEYWATIPANWRYNIALKGFLPLKKNESSILKDYFTVAGGKADCVKYKWAMEDVPAFYEEEYMTSKKNFLSSINFELLQIEYFDGRKDKITKEWKDVEQELRTWDKFGLQLKRGKDIVDEKIETVIANETDDLVKAQKIYDFIRNWYQWNETRGYYSESGIKKAFDTRKGNVGDINLSLIAALRYAGLNTEPMILSTRDNGMPTELFPVLSEFNYVVAKLNLTDKVYFLDATDAFLPFGLLPRRCLNGKGRVLGDKESYWYEIKPAERSRQISLVNLKMDDKGIFSGTVKTTYSGYRASEKRKDIYSHSSVDSYIKERTSESTNIEISDYAFSNLDEFYKPLLETFSVKIEGEDPSLTPSFFFNPFFLEKWSYNPFRSQERLYPVDFGVPMEEILVFTLELPEGIQPADLTDKIAIALPNNGGRLLYDVQSSGQRLVINSSVLISRSVYMPQEYPYLKEFFNRIVKIQATDLVFEKSIK